VRGIVKKHFEPNQSLLFIKKHLLLREMTLPQVRVSPTNLELKTNIATVKGVIKQKQSLEMMDILRYIHKGKSGPGG
jgi:hypothetical protein